MKKMYRDFLKINLKKGLIVSLCLSTCISLAACDMGKSKSSGNATQSSAQNEYDLRNSKVIGQQQAILKFTTSEKAGGSILYVNVKPVEGKYIYTVSGITRKGQNIVFTIDGKSGKVTKEEDKGIATKEMKLSLIDFVPVMDLDAAAKAAEKASENKYTQVLGYTLFFKAKRNVYKFTLGDGSESGGKTEEVLIDGITGQKLTKNDLTIDAAPSATEGTSSNSTTGTNSTSTNSDSTDKSSSTNTTNSDDQKTTSSNSSTDATSSSTKSED